MKKVIALICAVLMACCFLCTIHAAGGYSDVSKTAWYYDTVTQMSDDGYLLGYRDGTFQPNKKMTAAEFICVVERAFGDPSSLPKAGEWANYQWHSLEWVPDYLFLDGYNQYINRNDAALLLLLAKDEPVLNQMLYDNDPDIKGNVSDAMFSCKQYGYIKGYGGGEMRSHNLLTRAEACTILYRAIYVYPTPEIPQAKTSGLNYKMDGFGQYEELARQKMEVALLRIPQEVRTRFMEEGYHLIAAEGKEYEKNWTLYLQIPYQQSTGVFSGDKKIILISRTSASTVFHEFGHFVDEYYASDEKINELFASESAAVADVAMKDYCLTNAGEFFAEAYRCYIEKPNILMVKAPLTYKYIASLY